MYGKCQALNDAQALMSMMKHRDVYTWTFIIGAFAELGQSRNALLMYEDMQRDGVKPNECTFVYLLSSCDDKAALEEGRHVHMLILISECEAYAAVSTALICMYNRCGSLDDAWHVADSTYVKDTISWNALIAVSAEHGDGNKSMQLFLQMQVEGFTPNEATFLSILSAFMDRPGPLAVKRIHALIRTYQFDGNIPIANALITLYGKCGCIEDAHLVFYRMPNTNVISWTAMIAAAAECGWSKEVTLLLQKMQFEGVAPDKITFASSLSSCVKHESLLDGLWLHACISRSGLESDVVVGTALITMYGKCGSIESARKVFERLPKRDVICWNAMIGSYAQCGHNHEVSELLREMEMVDLKPSKITFVSILDSCASGSALDEGRCIHACLMEYDFESELVVLNALVNMYGKCGSLEDSQTLFDKMDEKNVVSWTAIIAAYGQQGQGKEAMAFFEKMKEEGVVPNEITFISAVSACSHAGMVEEAFYCLFSMVQQSEIMFTAEHYDCMVDLICRTGLLSHGQAMISSMPFQPNATTWMAFLGACKMHSNMSEAVQSSVYVLEVDSYTAAPYVLLSNIYSGTNKLPEEDFEELIKCEQCI